MPVTLIDPDDGSGLTYRVAGREVTAVLEGEPVARFDLGPEASAEWATLAVLSWHLETMAIDPEA